VLWSYLVIEKKFYKILRWSAAIYDGVEITMASKSQRDPLKMKNSRCTKSMAHRISGRAIIRIIKLGGDPTR
jgi:hypothetical protein